MTRIRPNTLALSLIFLAVAGMCIGVSIFKYAAIPEGRVDINPTVVDIPTDVMQHQKVSAYLSLRNNTASPVVLRATFTSCGCTSLVTRGGQGLTEPITIPSRGAIPWQVDIETQGRVGLQEFKVTFEVEAGGVSTQVESLIKMNILEAIDLTPQMLRLDGLHPGEVRHSEVVLSDGYPGRGYVIKNARVSDSSRVGVTVLPAASGAATAIAGNGVAVLLPRTLLKVVYTAPASASGTVYDEVILEPEDKMHPLLSISIVCNMTPLNYELVPSRLTFSADLIGQSAHRVVTCRVRPGADSSLRVLSAPDSVRVDFSDAGPGLKRLAIHFDPLLRHTPAAIGSAGIVIGVVGGSTPAFTIPLDYIAR